MLYQVPNQPLFDGRVEDDLITETWLKYLETGDETWPLLFPMVKSATKAMDALQEFTRKERGVETRGFVITGASKRGWTSWLTAAADRRVVGTAPMVIDMLNFAKQMPHQKSNLGQVQRANRRLHEQRAHPRRRASSGKPRGTPVADDGPLDLPPSIDAAEIAGGGGQRPVLGGGRDEPLLGRPVRSEGVAAHPQCGAQPQGGARTGLDHDRDFLPAHGCRVGKCRSSSSRAVATGFAGAKDRGEREEKPVRVRLWTAVSPTKDFRNAEWKSQALPSEEGMFEGSAPRPKEGHIAVFGEAQYLEGGAPFSVTTLVYWE